MLSVRSPISAGRRGAAALITVVGLVTVGLLSAVAVLPLYETSVVHRRIDHTHEFLVHLTDTQNRAMQRFVGIHGQPPRLMTHLSSAPSGQGACGSSYGSTGDWEPHVDRHYLATGVPTPLGTIDDTLVRVGAEVMVAFSNIRLSDAERFDRWVDDPTGSTTGRVRWVVTDATQELVSLRWVTPFTC